MDPITQGALGAALGSACNDATEAQSMALPSMLPVMLPMFIMMPVLMNPESGFATGLSLFPLFTPLLMLLRQVTPTGIESWQPAFEEAGAVFSGLSPDGKLVEIIELPDHPFFIGTQFHPEFLSKPIRGLPGC